MFQMQKQSHILWHFVWNSFSIKYGTLLITVFEYILNLSYSLLFMVFQTCPWWMVLSFIILCLGIHRSFAIFWPASCGSASKSISEIPTSGRLSFIQLMSSINILEYFEENICFTLFIIMPSVSTGRFSFFTNQKVFCCSKDIYHFIMFLIGHVQLKLPVDTFRTVCKQMLSSMSTLIKHISPQSCLFGAFIFDESLWTGCQPLFRFSKT